MIEVGNQCMVVADVRPGDVGASGRNFVLVVDVVEPILIAT